VSGLYIFRMNFSLTISLPSHIWMCSTTALFKFSWFSKTHFYMSTLFSCRECASLRPLGPNSGEKTHFYCGKHVFVNDNVKTFCIFSLSVNFLFDFLCIQHHAVANVMCFVCYRIVYIIVEWKTRFCLYKERRV
jgi:hypothetical protein